jgi:ubiquinone/menaquinone biosynthesis C-methylase UbiE
MASGAGNPDYTFEAFARHDFYRRVNEHLVDATLQFREKLSQLPILRALDLACGTGAVTQLLVDRVRRLRQPVEVVAVDSSESALEKARRLLGTAARFARGRAEAFSNVVSNVDVMLFCNAIHMLPDKDQVVAEARKAMNLDGVIGFNTSFYEGCYAPGTEKFYKVWMLRSLQLLKEETGLKPDRSKVPAMRWLTPDDYRALLERHQFVVEDMHTEEADMPCKSWQDISQYAEFANGALPGVPLEVAVPVLQQSVARTYEELDLDTVPRNWLQVVARAV